MTAHYNRGFTISNIQLKSECLSSHSFGPAYEVSTSCISDLGHKCENCGVIEYFTNDGSCIDFTKNMYGADMDNDEATPVTYNKGQISATGIGEIKYKLDSNLWDTTEGKGDNIAKRRYKASLPRINLSKFSSVEFDLKSFDNGSGSAFSNEQTFGFENTNMSVMMKTQADVNGKITISKVTGENKYKITFNFGVDQNEFSKDITDADIISGNKSIHFYITAHFNRGFTLSNIQLENN